jgi:hypothetical protein
MIIHLIVSIVSATVSGVLVHFFWSKYHSDITTGLTVAFEEAKRLRFKAEQDLAALKSQTPP